MNGKFTVYNGLDLPNVAKEVLAFWKSKQIFEKSITSRQGKTPFVFFDGPPSANGLPGIHHVMARSIKDIFCRYKTQKGFQVKRKAGWDTHGLPVELGVEKQLGITKEDIGTKISIEDYNQACREAVMKYTDVWSDLTEKIGYWVDMDDAYITYDSKYMESVWWLLSELYKKDLIYKGYTIQPYSPKAGTGLSSHELNQPGTYQDVTDTTVVAQFKTVESTLPDFLKGFGEIHLLAWTTTPWTLPSNTALTVGPKIEYVLVETFNQYTFEPIKVVLAKNLVAKQFAGKKFNAEATDEDFTNFSAGDKVIPYREIASFSGKDLTGIRYEQLLDYCLPAENPENAFRVILGDFVTTEDGTGIVHTAPTFGADDALVAKQATPPIPPMLVKDTNDNLVPLVDLQGKFTSHVGEFAGKYVKNAYYNEGEAPDKSVDVEIAIKLKIENKAFKVEKYVHSYPNCWRTDKPVLYYPLDSWFIKVTDVKDRMYDLNLGINWKPKATGEGRFGNWLANANDWNLSRSRYWGIPLPIWRTEDGSEAKVIGSIEELKNEMQKAVAAGLMQQDVFADFIVGDMSSDNYAKVDLHKNIVDAITLVSDSGKPMQRESDLIDVWFDSGAMPTAQWHYPFENKSEVEAGGRKADFIAEGVDQTRGWFYTLHAISTMIFDDVAYKNVVSNGLVLDKNGQKMSKRLGNAINAFDTLDTHGPDATRWYMISNANPWDNLKFDPEGILEVRRKFFGTLYNTYSFFALYANIDGFTYQEAEIPLTDRPEIDQWILSELHTLVGKVDAFYADYEPTRATRAISDFVQENLSNWYVRLCRRRFWKGAYELDKISAYQTLYTCLLTVSKLSAPVAPFFMDRLYQDLTKVCPSQNGLESVHLSEFPVANTSLINSALEQKMSKAQTVSSLVLSLRQKQKIKVRQPLSKVMIPVRNIEERIEIESVSKLIKSEVNVKDIELLDDASNVLVKKIKPNFKALGPKFGKQMKAIAAEIQDFSKDQIAEFETNGNFSFDLDGNAIYLEISDVEIYSEDIEGYLVASNHGVTVALDITLTPELIHEGIAREIVNRVQNIRKDTNLEVTDRIKIFIKDHEVLKTAVLSNDAYIKTETLANDIYFKSTLEKGISIAFDAIETEIEIQKV